jgi:lysyl-tRNA synthetase class 1
MFWADKIAEDIQEKLKVKIASGEPLVVRDEKTPSGRVHVGSMRGVAIHGIVADVLNERGISTTFSYEFNDIDPMDGIPSYIDEVAYREHFGKPLYAVPAPDPETGAPSSSGESYADYYAHEFQDVILQAGFNPSFHAARALYESGRMNDVIRTALEHAADIRRIYKEVSGSQKAEDWLPLSVICEQCGKILTTRAYNFDGETVQYVCERKTGHAGGETGCGHEGRTSPFDGRSKLPWKVDWAAKWKVLGVSIEGAGKDHSTKGGSRDVANHISREVFGQEPPYDIPYEFFLVGGAKMASSKGRGASAAEVSTLVPTPIFRLVLLGTKPMRAINLDPSGDTIPTWFDWYDKIAEKHWDGVGDDDARLFGLIHRGDPPARRYLARFSIVAFLVQMEHLSVEEEIAKIKGEYLTEEERADLTERAQYARTWLAQYAPDRYKFELQATLPQAAAALSPRQKEALSLVCAYAEKHEHLDGQEFHTALHDIRKKLDIDPKEFFSALYLVTIGKESGPKAGWFLSVLDRDFLIARLREASTQA